MDVKLTAVLISASVALTIGFLTYFHNRSTQKEQKRSDKRKGIVKRLNEFYGPLASYLNVTKALHKIYSANKPKGFRTLTYLLNPDQEYESENRKIKITLNESDKELLKEIIKVEKQIEKLIIEKAGLIDQNALMFDYLQDPLQTDVKLEDLSLLAIAITHFRVLRLANKGYFKGEGSRFKNFVYPKELDIKLQERIEELRSELEKLTT